MAARRLRGCGHRCALQDLLHDLLRRTSVELGLGRGQQTVGEDGVWFADQESEKFRRINRLTATLNVPLYMFLGLLLAAAFGLLS